MEIRYIVVLLAIFSLEHATYILAKDDSLLQQILNKINERKLNLLTKFVALDWGFNGTTAHSQYSDTTNITSDAYLEEVADLMLYNYNLTIRQKVNSIKVKHILSLYQRTALYEEHVDRATDLDKNAAAHNGSLSSVDNKKYLFEEQLIGTITLREGQIATDLLVQSFAPCNVYQKSHDFNNTESNQEQEKIAQSLRRATGTINLVNMLFDPPYRWNISRDEAAALKPRELFKKLQKLAIANFEVIFKPTTTDEDEEVESTISLPTVMVNTSNDELTYSIGEVSKKRTSTEDIFKSDEATKFGMALDSGSKNGHGLPVTQQEISTEATVDAQSESTLAINNIDLTHFVQSTSETIEITPDLFVTKYTSKKVAVTHYTSERNLIISHIKAISSDTLEGDVKIPEPTISTENSSKE